MPLSYKSGCLWKVMWQPISALFQCAYLGPRKRRLNNLGSTVKLINGLLLSILDTNSKFSLSKVNLAYLLVPMAT